MILVSEEKSRGYYIFKKSIFILSTSTLKKKNHCTLGRPVTNQSVTQTLAKHLEHYS